MQKIGITGGIGSGKTTVCRIFELLDIPVYYSDLQAKDILQNDHEIKKEITNLFGIEILDSNNLIDRNKLSSLVFNNDTKLKKLNEIIHPAVARHFSIWITQYKDKPYILKEAAILFESGANKQVDKVITVIAPVELKIKRTILRDNSSKEQVESRIKNQSSDEEKINRSDFVINNNEEQLLIPQILKIHNLLIK